jgi:general stress protein YciG
MDPAKQREIASKGGHAAHAKGTAHEFTSEEARAAGRIGGEHSHKSSRGAQPASRESYSKSASESETGQHMETREHVEIGHHGHETDR